MGAGSGTGLLIPVEYQMRKPRKVFAGIDIGAKELVVALRLADGGIKDLKFENTPQGHKKLANLLKKGGRLARVVCEATSLYGLDLALALDADGIELMQLNPLAARRFMESQMRRAKTDKVDARALLEFLERMEFVPWNRPSKPRLGLRFIARRIDDLIKIQTAEKNRLHALKATDETPKVLLDDLEEGINALEQRIDVLLGQAVELMQTEPELKRAYDAATSICGIADRSSVQILGELLLLPADMTPKQVVAHAGLDPRPRESGKKCDGMRHISKLGSSSLRAALHFPTLTAIQHQPVVRKHYEHLLKGRNDHKMIAVVAVSRKLLQSLWRMIQTGEAFDPARFSPRFGGPVQQELFPNAAA